MLTAEQIAALRDLSGQLMDPVTEFLIRDIAQRVSEAGQLTGTAAYQTWQLQKLGVSQKKLKEELQKQLKVSQKRVEQLLTQAAAAGYDFDISRFPTVDAIPFEENTSIQQILDAAVKLAQDDLTNITQTIGFVTPTGKAVGLTDAYKQTCDFAFMKVATGAQDYISAVREATKALAEKGIQVIDYESGVHTSLEAAVRRNIMGGLGLMQEQISQQNHDDLGCDGWEISAHGGSAPDHEPFQGRQYPDKQYHNINNSLHRRIGTLNCGHSAMPIIIGVNSPQYNDEELEEFRKQNEEGVTVGDKHYTLYEATQRQRSIERSIRKIKRRILIDEATGDTEKLQWDQIRLVRIHEEYHRFSKAAKLPEQYERMEKSGFGYKHGSAAAKSANAYYKYWSKSIGANESAKTLADYYEMKYNRTDEYKLLKQYAKDVKDGWISPLSGFENYKNLYGRIQSEIVGKTAANGTGITGQVPHFMQRVIGTMADPQKLKNDLQVIRRSGVEIDDIADALFHPESIDPPTKRANGKTSVRFIGTKCVVTINPDEGLLIQTNPRKVRK
jgi:hypothetical protein